MSENESGTPKILAQIEDQSELIDQIDLLKKGLADIGKEVDEELVKLAEKREAIFLNILDDLKTTLKYVDEKLVSEWWEKHESRKQYNRMENTLPGNYLLLAENNIIRRVLQVGTDDEDEVVVKKKFQPPLTLEQLNEIKDDEVKPAAHFSSMRYYLMRDKNDLKLVRMNYDTMSAGLLNYVIDHQMYRNPTTISFNKFFQIFSLEEILNNLIKNFNDAISENKNRLPLLKKRVDQLNMVAKMINLT
ncbi:MAG: hypothetical protein INQ03_07875 [Candidatus Heimdallarchaeota archaeon]|nr:hypothetical protein [Candidatus Heimdallarchaeota archaeon]